MVDPASIHLCFPEAEKKIRLAFHRSCTSSSAPLPVLSVSEKDFLDFLEYVTLMFWFAYFLYSVTLFVTPVRHVSVTCPMSSPVERSKESWDSNCMKGKWRQVVRVGWLKAGEFSYILGGNFLFILSIIAQKLIIHYPRKRWLLLEWKLPAKNGKMYIEDLPKLKSLQNCGHKHQALPTLNTVFELIP